jgi:hypothetical protein
VWKASRLLEAGVSGQLESDRSDQEVAGFFLPLGTARYTAVTAVTAGVR